MSPRLEKERTKLTARMYLVAKQKITIIRHSFAIYVMASIEATNSDYVGWGFHCVKSSRHHVLYFGGGGECKQCERSGSRD
jgi:hypothetical protein